MKNEVKTMLVLFVPGERKAGFAHQQMVDGGFDATRPIEVACAVNAEGLPDDQLGMFLMQEVRHQS